MAGKKPYPNPSDIKGTKVGTTTNKMINEFWELYGAIPVAHISRLMLMEGSES